MQVTPLPFDDDSAWAPWAEQWRIRGDTLYLNHGSFGPPPEMVRQARAVWQAQLDEQPMDFFLRRLEPAWREARRRVAQFVGAAEDNLVFASNATAGMNVVAGSFPLAAGDEVLLTDHEYGAVTRIWERACRRSGARVTTVSLPLPLEAFEQVTDAITAAITSRTRLLVVSHITSPTAITLPVGDICRAAHERDVAVCIDGPHAVAQLELRLDELGCDFYVASGHKWLSAPFGSGFLYVHPRWQSHIEPPLLSWGVLSPAKPSTWWEEFYWTGTTDPSAMLTMPVAIDFLEQVGLPAFRGRTHYLAQYARRRLEELTKRTPLTPDSADWYGAMAHVPLPPGDAATLQRALWERYQIEAPIVAWNGSRYIRVSCHLYNNTRHIDRLVAALASLL